MAKDAKFATVKLSTQGLSQAKANAVLQKMRNVGRARGRGVTIHPGMVATTILPRRKGN